MSKPPKMGISQKIAVFRALKLGDLLCAVPALRALRAALPGARITLIGLPWAREFVERYCSYLDDFREFPGYPGLPEQEPDLGRIPAFLAAMQAERFDLAIQLHGSGRLTNPLVALFGARQMAGFHDPGSSFEGVPGFLRYPERGLELRKLIRLMEFLGVPSCGEALEFPVWPSDRGLARQLLSDLKVAPQGFVVLHPGASVPERRWAAADFAVVGDALASHGYTVLVTGTPGESPLASAVIGSMTYPAYSLAGRTTLGPLAAFLSEARILICNDTGVSHIADALRVPSVVISTGDNPDRWAPADGHRHRVLCRPGGVTPRHVIAEAIDLLETNPDRNALIAPGEPVGR